MKSQWKNDLNQIAEQKTRKINKTQTMNIEIKWGLGGAKSKQTRI